jgi:hypothetical protein
MSVLFMVVSRPKPGTKREQLIDRLTQTMDPEGWDLVRRGELSQIMYKVGDEPGFFALLSAPSAKEASAMIERGIERLEVFDLDLVPVKHFPLFE